MFQEGNKNKNLLLTSSLYIKQKEYWVNKLSGTLTNTKLLPDHIKRCRYTHHTTGNQREKVEIYISTDLFLALMKLSKETDLSLYIILLTALKSLIYHYTGNEDIVLISPLYKMNITGDTLNRHLFIRQQDVGQLTFKELLLEIRQSVFESYENQDYPSNDLIDFLYNSGQIQDNDFSSNIECLLQNIHNYNDSDYEDIKDRLVFSFLREDSHIRGHVLYNPVIYDKFYLEQVARHFVRILECAVENVNINIPGIFFLSLEERQQLIHDFNKTRTEYRKDKLTHERFEEKAVHTPDHIAAVYEDLQVSYSYLNKKSHKLAQLLQKKGVKPDTIIGIMVERTFEMLVGIWGVLQAGGAYLPIDPDYPGNRIKFMLEDSNAEILLSEGKELSKVSGETEVIDLSSLILMKDDAEPNHLTHLTHPIHLCYVIYTSGSTGMPKGVLIQHRNLLAYIEAFYKEFEISHQDTVIQQSSYTFDASVEEIFPALLKGCRLVVPNKDEIVDLDILLELITKHNVTIISCSPLLLNELNRVLSKLPIHTYISGSDVLKAEYIQNLLEAGKVYNTYGPTETTVCATYHRCSAASGSNILIGKPILNYQVYIVGKNDQLLPIGVIGELCVSGEGVSRGYLNRPELTAEKFDHDFWDFQDYRDERKNKKFLRGVQGGGFYKKSPSGRRRQKIYKTGDLARWLVDGNIEFLGRIDHQVKIRGYRIELEEIERRLLAHHEIKKAIVVSNAEDLTDHREGKQPGEQYVCAYIVSGKELAVSELREYLSRNLPAYMIPSYFISLERIPVTSTGKIDRRALPPPRIKTADNHVPPRNETEEKMVCIWAEVLELDKDVIGIDAVFFELGGHSLKATILAAKIQKAFNIRLPLAQVFKMPTIRKLAGFITDEAVEEMYITMESVEKKEFYPLSSAQARLYVIQQMELESVVYNMPLVMALEGKIEVRKLERISRELIHRHESLRTSFMAVEDEPVQRVQEEVDFEIEYHELPRGSTEGKQQSIEKIMKEFIRSFDISHVPLLRVGLVKQEEQKNILMVDMHHIISDGISLDILEKDFFALYKGEKLKPLRIQYKDFSRWQNSEREMEKPKQQEAFWLKEFDSEIPVMDLPIDYIRPAVRNFEGNTVNFEIGRKETASLKNMALKENATLYIILLGLYNILLSKLSGCEDIIIGTAIAGRRHADLLQVIGMFVNMLVLRNFPDGEKTVSEFLGEVKNRTLNAFENQDYPFEDLVDQVSVRKDMSRNPIFDITFAFDNIDIYTDKDKNSSDRTAGETSGQKRPLQHSPRLAYERQLTKFDLILAAIEMDEKLLFSFQYGTKLFKEETIARFVEYFKKIVSIIVEEPDIRLSGIEIISEKEKKRILYDFNNTKTAYPQDKTIHRLFEEQVEKAPDSTAVVGATVGRITKRFIASAPQNVHVTFAKLNESANRLAHRLMEKGVKPNTIVGIMAERSLEMIVGLAGILKAGGAYLPIDPDYPEKRIRYMLVDSNAKVLLAASAAQVKVKAEVKKGYLDLIDISKPLPSSTSTLTSTSSKVTSANLAYVIYTSGTTGIPKGVLIRHRGFINLISGHCKVFKEAPGSRISQVASPAFDAMASEVWPGLANGAAIYIADSEIRANPARMKEWLIREGITISFQSTIMAEALLEEEWPEQGVALRVLRTAGDRLKKYPKHSYSYPFRFYNLYGPTEDTVWTTWTEVEAKGKVELVEDKFPTIGKPIDNHKVYIISPGLSLQPIGVAGELWVSGEGLAVGYLNNPELTAEKFHQDLGDFQDYRDEENYQKFFGGSRGAILKKSPGRRRLYKTGDLGRWLLNGTIEFLGRMDLQVKIRGYRVELGEIENRLLDHEKVKEVTVVVGANENAGKYLCAYIVPYHPRDYDPEASISRYLKEYLSLFLPDYMIPSYFIQLEKLPLTANGKIDRKALPAPQIKVGGAYIAPRDELEEKLMEIWTEVLDRDTPQVSQNESHALIGIDDDFFESGGHSLKAAVMASKIYEELKVKLPLVEVFKTSTIRRMAQYIRSARNQSFIAVDDNLVLLKEKSGTALNLFFIHDGTGEVEGYVEFCRHLDSDLNCWGIRADKLESLAPKKWTIGQMAQNYMEKIRKIQPRGPYYIAGWSFGGTIAFEMVRQLENLNEEINFLALIDSYPPYNKGRKSTGEFDFNLQSELDYIKDYSLGNEIREKLKNETDINRFWLFIVEYLEKSNVEVKLIKKKLTEFGMQALPDYNQLNIKESIYYMNRGRTFHNAREWYSPPGKVHTPVHYFAASESKEIFNREQWNQYTEKPIKAIEITGDHLSIFKVPRVAGFAKVFNNILDETRGELMKSQISKHFQVSPWKKLLYYLAKGGEVLLWPWVQAGNYATIIKDFLCRSQSHLTCPVHPHDIFIATYPKSGTTWMQMILYQLKTDGDMDFKHIGQISPFWDEMMQKEEAEFLSPPRVFKTHLPYKRVPKYPCKYIYIVRDFRDVAVSFFHHYWNLKVYRKNFDHFFYKIFLKSSWYTSWFKHVHDWYMNPKKLNILYIKYEDMKKDLPGVIRQVSDFCQFPLNETVLQRVVERSQFSFMKQYEEKFNPSMGSLLKKGINPSGFLRKGEVGGWQDYFKEEHLEECRKLHLQWISGKVDLPYDLQTQFHKKQQS